MNSLKRFNIVQVHALIKQILLKSATYRLHPSPIFRHLNPAFSSLSSAPSAHSLSPQTLSEHDFQDSKMANAMKIPSFRRLILSSYNPLIVFRQSSNSRADFKSTKGGFFEPAPTILGRCGGARRLPGAGIVAHFRRRGCVGDARFARLRPGGRPSPH